MTSISLPSVKEVRIGPVTLGGRRPLALIAGPCVIESEGACLEVAAWLKELTRSLGIPLIFKSSYDKANRSSLRSYRGPGLDQGLKVLSRVKRELEIPVLSDVHRFEEVKEAAQVLDVLQVPAFLCRQTDFVMAIAQAGKVVNVKKGQFLAPWDLQNIVEKIESAGNQSILLTERGVSFGYNNLVADMRSLVILRQTGYPVIYDVTHSLQLPGGLGTSSGGQREYIPPLARAGVAAGIDGLFMEVHPNPSEALCDGPNSQPLKEVGPLLEQLVALDRIVKTQRA
ncbi:MAG TPA: 3-deoxy-8-phosphooctulonate synthase [Thermodesulfobacteriota bacterium]|nr:3-deoxy-8-phosphooctulonate synthase [Thermodesulfobacteriota bacterium]